jgi:hypothetical protein
MKASENVCSYWQRQEAYAINDNGFGIRVQSIMTEEQIDRLDAVREKADAEDPPCGECEACRYAEQDQSGPPDEWFAPDVEASSPKPAPAERQLLVKLSMPQVRRLVEQLGKLQVADLEDRIVYDLFASLRAALYHDDIHTLSFEE